VAVLLNRPSGGTQRVNGNHLGVFARVCGNLIRQVRVTT
jgi:hypothetical protein